MNITVVGGKEQTSTAPEAKKDEKLLLLSSSTAASSSSSSSSSMKAMKARQTPLLIPNESSFPSSHRASQSFLENSTVTSTVSSSMKREEEGYYDHPSQMNTMMLTETIPGAITATEQQCPLFMDGLQSSDFAQNSALAALASLIDEDDDETYDDDGDDDDDDDGNKNSQSAAASSSSSTKSQPKSGGGKTTKVPKRAISSNCSPYFRVKEASKSGGHGMKKTKEKQKGSATLGEAQLFLNIWKI